jgi:hypothetical protein
MRELELSLPIARAARAGGKRIAAILKWLFG